jgi:glyoxylase-like metal-dependent hydrolase (beta-lactamase superfamily II)
MKIDENIHRIDNVSGNVYLIDDILIDTGLPRSEKKIRAYLRKMGKTPSMIVITHSHLDHVGSLRALKETIRAEVIVHELEKDALAGKEPLPSPKSLVGFFFRVVSLFYRYCPAPPDRVVREGDTIGNFTVIHIPGHTPGSIALYDAERKIMVVGDTVRYIRGKIQGAPSFFTINKDQARRSIEKIASYDFDLLLSGHGEPLRRNAAERVRVFAQSLNEE